jgi:pimeloyl-ACP methyl ester carboxylesterase
MIKTLLRHLGYSFAAVLLSVTMQVPAQAAAKRERCFLPGLEDAADCITLTVPLDWQKPAGAKITVFTAVLPALSRDAARDAFVMIPGGPGQSGDSLVPLAKTAFRDIRKQRDLVLIYPRGTARSTPLTCSQLDTSKYLPRQDMLARVKTCAATQKIDVQFFTSAEIVRDVEEMRRVMGYPQLSLWGGSFGSRLVQHYARAFPATTRLAIMDAVAPAGVSIVETSSKAADAALASIDIQCRMDSACRKTAPALGADVKSILDSFVTPRSLRVTDPVTGRMTDTLVDRQYLASVVHLTLYNPQSRALLPQLVAAAKKGAFEPLLAMGALSGSSLFEQISVGANFSALCAEDWAITTRSKVEKNSFLGTSQADMLRDICPVWTSRKLDPSFLRPFKSSVPALLLSGALDPITPPDGGAQAARYFSTVTHVVVPASAHISSTFGCAPRQIAAFVSTGKTTASDWACVKRAKPPAPLGTPNG